MPNEELREKIVEILVNFQKYGGPNYIYEIADQILALLPKPELADCNPKYCWDKTHYRGGSDKGIGTCMDCGKLIGEFFNQSSSKKLPEKLNIQFKDNLKMLNEIVDKFENKINEIIDFLKE